MIKKYLSFSILLFTIASIYAQTPRPKLAVGIVVDQMRPEYLYRFSSSFGKGGFNRLINEGFVCYNTQIDYLPTVTGPGHASIYTGTTPKYHGICGNNWFDRTLHKVVYCAKDTAVETIGNDKKEKLDEVIAKKDQPVVLPALGWKNIKDVRIFTDVKP